MVESTKQAQTQQAIMSRVLCFFILSGLFIIAAIGSNAALQGGTGIPPKPETWSVMSILGLVLAGTGVLCRLLVVPQVGAVQAQFTTMVIGLARCEACGLIGIFVLDSRLPRERIFLF